MFKEKGSFRELDSLPSRPWLALKLPLQAMGRENCFFDAYIMAQVFQEIHGVKKPLWIIAVRAFLRKSKSLH